jgi:DNA (cytosine-5)-methyltransferase 1
MKDVRELEMINTEGFFAKAFPIVPVEATRTCDLPNDIIDVSDSFKFDFGNAGYMKDGVIYTASVTEIEEKPVVLGSILQSNVDESFYITTEKMSKWTYMKGAKKIPRKSADGHEYVFSEGPIAFPDPWDRPGRTMLTSEGTLNRSTHIVSDPGTGRLRILTPIEAERLQGFDDDWTNSGMPQRMRFFCMGNALVVPMITRMGRVLDLIIEREN